MEIEVCTEGMVSFTIDEYIVFANISFDTDAENPLEEGYGGMGRIYSLSCRHNNYISPARFRKFLRDNKYAVVLSYYEHGLCRWFVRDGSSGGMSPYDFRWDGVLSAGVWIADKDCMREIRRTPMESRREKALSIAAGACEAYTAWCSGEVYCWDFEIYLDRFPYNELRDYRFEDPRVTDGCCGYYTEKEARADMNIALNNELKSLGITERVALL